MERILYVEEPSIQFDTNQTWSCRNVANRSFVKIDPPVFLIRGRSQGLSSLVSHRKEPPVRSGFYLYEWNVNKSPDRRPHSDLFN